MAKELTSSEKDLQNRRGAWYKKIMMNATKDFIDGIPEKDRDKVGILLSGGVDSTTVLWGLLEYGIRPHVYTFHLPTNTALSTDAKKAKHFAETYDLPFHLVEMTSDPDELAQRILELNDNFPLMDDRPDFEVIPIFTQILLEARNDGMLNMFSGIEDGNIHMLGRKLEVRARGEGGIPTSEADARRIFFISDDQVRILMESAHDMGMKLCLPLAMACSMQPYHNVPWHVMNTPRKKEIIMRQWEMEEKLSGTKVVVSSLQNGDAGGRAYYDGLLPKSKFATDLVGRDITTAQVYYNWLRARHREGSLKSQYLWNWFSHVTAGRPLPEEFITERFADPKTGRSPLPEEEEEGIFGNLMEDERVLHLDENGEIDTRVDCFGNAFYDGPDVAMTTCARARAGHCGKFKPDVPYEIEKCELWDDWNGHNVELMFDLAELSSGGAKEVYLKWADIVKQTTESIKNHTCAFE